MLKTILVPVDFSSTSENAAQYALQLCKQTGSKIILVHAYEPPPSFPMVEGLIYTEESLRELMRQKLDILAAKFDKQEPFVKTESMLIDGKLTQVIHQLTDAMQVFMIVMGITGAGKLKETIIGSNTLSVAEVTKVPVLIVPEVARFTAITDIGLTTDFRDVAETIPYKKISELITGFGARLHVLNIDFNQQNWTNDTPFQSGLVETMFEHQHPTYHFVEGEDLAEGLSNYALTHSIEILIAVPRKQNLLQKLFSGSHTKELAFHSKVPVLVVHD
ncbi:MAG TPA: universal stress protein [Lacibacter sp.]|nr:universal stress protein [Lacibacter sp.]